MSGIVGISIGRVFWLVVVFYNDHYSKEKFSCWEPHLSVGIYPSISNEGRLDTSWVKCWLYVLLQFPSKCTSKDRESLWKMVESFGIC